MEELIEMGTNATREHQRILTKLSWLLNNLYHKGQIILEPISEAMVSTEQTSETPDVILVDKEENVKVIIEVCAKTGWRRDTKKVKRLIDDQNYYIEEGFVYDYEQNQWFGYSLENGEDTEQPAFSKLLNVDLADLLA